ncbi:MAG TPA: YhgN family NAAT transporter [Rhodanobacteraceae bacterium]|jgi:MarC family membrane protein|nr:YhgN family NAAT transporter [Rhodanobacteraceae bacterium]
MHTHITVLSAGVMLFLVLDPLGNVPFFLTILKQVPPKRRRWVMVRELLIALVVLVAFLVGGRELLAIMQLRQEAISIAGGIVLFLIAIKMVFPPKDGAIFGPVGQGEPFIVPLAIPGVAGPSAMAALLLLTSTQPGRQMEWGIALLAAWLATAVILLSSTWLFKLLGESVLTALERVMGMLLIALSVQMFLGGLEAYLHAG